MFYVLIPLATLLAGGVTPAVSLCPVQLIPIICQSLAQPRLSRRVSPRCARGGVKLFDVWILQNYDFPL